MFSVSFGECFIALIAAGVFLKPEDIKALYRYAKRFRDSISNIKNEVITSVIGDEAPTHYILDDDGNMQPAYTIDDIKPIIKNEEKSTKRKKRAKH